MFLIAGLGNPEKHYGQTRHNVGFMAADRLVSAAGGVFSPYRESHVSIIRRCKKTVLVAKPQTYMNQSGRAIRQLMTWQALEVSDLLVVYDDVALPLGRIRFRPRGSAGGHNGMKSIIAELGSEEFARLRIGIGRNEPISNLSAFVLDSFDSSEEELLEDVLDMTQSALDSLLAVGMAKSMERFNGRQAGTTSHTKDDATDE